MMRQTNRFLLLVVGLAGAFGCGSTVELPGGGGSSSASSSTHGNTVVFGSGTGDQGCVGSACLDGEGGGGGGAPTDPTCNSDCDQLKFFGCITPSQSDACEKLCGSASKAAKSDFEDCAGPAQDADCDGSCYYAFDPSAPEVPSPNALRDCKEGCKDLAFFDCFATGADEIACEKKCATYTADEIAIFNTCSENTLECSDFPKCMGQ